MNVYLFEKNVTPLHTQKNARELEQIIQECILTTIRESIPTEAIIRAYMDESDEQEEQVFIEAMKEPEMVAEDAELETDKKEDEEKEELAVVPSIRNLNEEKVVTKLSFNDMDSVLNGEDKEEVVEAPKTLERLEEISVSRALERRMEEDDDEDEDRIQIHTDSVDLSGFDVLDLEPSSNMKQNSSLAESEISLDIEEL